MLKYSPDVLLEGTRFGVVEYALEDILTFAEGLVGLPTFTQFLLLNHRPGSPFKWLQSVESPGTAFLVASPEHYCPDYSPQIPTEDATKLALDECGQPILLVTASIPSGKPQELTLNLAGPIVINGKTRQGKQWVISDESYTTCHRVFPVSDETSAEAA